MRTVKPTIELPKEAFTKSGHIKMMFPVRMSTKILIDVLTAEGIILDKPNDVKELCNAHRRFVGLPEYRDEAREKLSRYYVQRASRDPYVPIKKPIKGEKSALSLPLGEPLPGWAKLSKPKKVKKAKKVRVHQPKEHDTRPVLETPFVQTDGFLRSYEWRELRYKALQLHGRRCQCCGASATDGATMNVDHIKPRRKYPEFALDIKNLQVLCDECNHGKGNWDQTDFRPNAAE